MLDTFQGLPVHALIIHATVVTLPLAAVLVALSAVYPRFRTWIGPVPAIVAVVGLVLVPLTTGSGDELKDKVDPGPACAGLHDAIERHEELGGWMLWLVIVLAVVAVAGYLLHRRESPSRALVITVALLSVLSAGTVLVQVARVGHSGAEATWKAQC